MKKVNMKIVLFGLLTLGCFLFFGTDNVQAQAQTLQKATSQTQFVSFQEALDILADELYTLKTDLSVYPQASTPYKETARKYVYYQELNSELQKQMKLGGTVGNAIEKALLQSNFNTSGSNEINFTKQQQNALRQGAIDLLRA